MLELQKIETWTYGKCELYHWIDILDLCDDILEDATRREQGSWVSQGYMFLKIISVGKNDLKLKVKRQTYYLKPLLILFVFLVICLVIS